MRWACDGKEAGASKPEEMMTFEKEYFVLRITSVVKRAKWFVPCFKHGIAGIPSGPNVIFDQPELPR